AALGDRDAGMWLALLVPDAAWLGFTPTGGSEQLWLFASDGSWSVLDDDTMRVEQYGPRKLWGEIGRAYRRGGRRRAPGPRPARADRHRRRHAPVLAGLARPGTVARPSGVIPPLRDATGIAKLNTAGPGVRGAI